jgi:hypothetical protein
MGQVDSNSRPVVRQVDFETDRWEKLLELGYKTGYVTWGRPVVGQVDLETDRWEKLPDLIFSTGRT